MPHDEQLQKRRRKLIEVSRTAPIIQSLGCRLSYNELGEAVWDMPYDPAFDHALQAIHGGVFATLLDNAGWFTVAPHYDRWIATVEFQVRLLVPVQREDLRAVGHIVRLGRRLATARMEVAAPGDGRIVAVGSGSFALTSVAALF